MLTTESRIGWPVELAGLDGLVGWANLWARAVTRALATAMTMEPQSMFTAFSFVQKLVQILGQVLMNQ